MLLTKDWSYLSMTSIFVKFYLFRLSRSIEFSGAIATEKCGFGLLSELQP